MELIIAATREAVAVVLLGSALSKVLEPSRFVDTLAAYGLPFPNGRPVAAVVVLLECAAAVQLLRDPNPLTASALAVLVFVTFAAAMLRARRRGLAVNCGCGGILGDRPVDGPTIMRALTLAAAAVFTASAQPTTSMTPIALMLDGRWPAFVAAQGLTALVLFVFLAFVDAAALERRRAVIRGSSLFRGGRTVRS